MIWVSTMDPVEIDDTTVGEAFGRAIAAHPDRTALIDGVERRHDDATPSSVAPSSGSPPGCPPTAFGPAIVSRSGRRTGLRWPRSCWAALRLGATVTGLNPASTDGEVLVQLDDADASVIVTAPELVDRALALGRRRVIVVGDAPGADLAVGGRWRAPLTSPTTRSTVIRLPCCRTRAVRPVCPKASC